MTTHFEHGAALVQLDGHEFFIDSTDPAVSDDSLGQMLCGTWFDAGRELEHLATCNSNQAQRLRDLDPYVTFGIPISTLYPCCSDF